MLLCKSLPFKTNKLWIVELKKIGKNIWDRFSFFLFIYKARAAMCLHINIKELLVFQSFSESSVI